MSKILFIIPSLGVGGAEKSLITLLNSIDTSNDNVSLLLLHDHGALFNQINKRIEVIDADKDSQKLLDPLIPSLKYFFRMKKFKIVFFRFVASLVHRFINNSVQIEWKLLNKFYKNIIGQYDIAIAYLQGVAEYFVVDKVNANKKVLWMHTSFLYHCLPNDYERKYVNAFSKIVCVSEAAKKDFLELFPNLSDSTIVFYNLIDSKQILLLSNQPCDVEFDQTMLNIVSVGRLHVAKGYDISIKAFANFQMYYPETRFYIIGDGPQKKELERLINTEKIADKCFLLGSKLNPYNYMKNSSIILQASRYEGYCIVLAEAKCLGKQIISTDFFGAREQLGNEKDDLIVHCDEMSIFKALMKVSNEKRETTQPIQEFNSTMINVSSILE